MGTKKTKKVLIALDYDPEAQKVAESGFSVAEGMNAKVILLHIISDPEHYSSKMHIRIMGFAGENDTASLKSDSVLELRKVAQKFLDKSKELLGDNTIETQLEEGNLSETILKAANDSHVDLIVLGSHIRELSSNILMVSVTEKVLRQSAIPLLIIPTKNHN